jgi:hypothetical protein
VYSAGDLLRPAKSALRASRYRRPQIDARRDVVTAHETAADMVIGTEAPRAGSVTGIFRAVSTRFRREIAALAVEVVRMPSYHDVAQREMQSRRRQAQAARVFSDGDPAI